MHYLMTYIKKTLIKRRGVRKGAASLRLRMVAAAVLALAVAFPASGEGAPVIVPGRELQLIMGDLCALSLAARLYYEDTHKTQCPALSDLARYFKAPLPSSWNEDCRVEAAGDTWWVGRGVPEFSPARKFFRENAVLLNLYDIRNNAMAWMGGPFVWFPAVRFEAGDKKGVSAPASSPVIRVAQGEGRDNQHLFFNSPGTEFFWWSDLLYTTDAHQTALRDFSAANLEGPFVIPPAPAESLEKLSASPVSPPPDYTLEKDEEDVPGFEMGDVILTPGGRN